MIPTGAGARLSDLHVPPTDDPSQSLLCCLEAVLSSYGCRVDRDELAVVLGDAVLVTYAAEARPGEQWNTYGRHAFLESAARLYGLELRDLHPPDAAPLPLPPPEFVGHFADSYLPLVRTALAHGYPALAWMGWPPPNRAIWGVVIRMDAASERAIGRTAFSGGQTVALEGPPVQVHTVQEFREVCPKAEDVLNAALDHTAAILNNRIPEKYRIVSGVLALEQLRDDAAAQAGVVRTWIAGRRSAVRYFRRFADHTKEAREYSAIFEEQMAALIQLTGEGPAAAAMDNVIALERRAAEVGANCR